MAKCQTKIQTRLIMNTDKQIRKIFRQEFVKIGVNSKNPSEMQKDFYFLRSWRKRSERAGYNATKTMTTVGIGAVLIALWEGIKNNLR